MSCQRVWRTVILGCLLVLCWPDGELRADTSFPDYYEMNNRANRLSPSEIPELIARADAGDVTSQILLGLAYQNGHGVREDHTTSFNWYLKAAEQGNAMGENLLGLAYDLGMGVQQDGLQAITWFRRSAEQKDYTGQRNLAVSLKNGVSLSKNLKDAKDEVQRDAEAGEVAAQIALGLAFAGEHNRLGIRKDPGQAAMWLEKASDTGSPIAQTNFAALCFAGMGVQRNEDRGLQLLLMATETRYAEAFYFLGKVYEHGQGVNKNKQTADMYYVLAEDSGKEVFEQRHGNVFTGGIAIFPDQRISLADAKEARRLANKWEATHEHGSK
jgi:TPR repeat protein